MCVVEGSSYRFFHYKIMMRKTRHHPCCTAAPI